MADWTAGGTGVQQYSGDREPYRRWPRPTPRIPALRRSAPTVRFITFETLVTGVRAFECAFSVRTSSFVHGLMTRRAVFAFAVLADFVTLTVFFKALGIIQVLHLNAAQIGMRCGGKKTEYFTYSFLSDNWYVIGVDTRSKRKSVASSATSVRKDPLSNCYLVWSKSFGK